jgi:hypothetical protein
MTDSCCTPPGLISLIGALWALSVLSGPASGQTTAAFEVASVRPSAEQASQASVGVHIDGSQVRIVGLPLKLYVGMAYGLKPQQIVGPDWLGQPRFDVAAKILTASLPLSCRRCSRRCSRIGSR